MLGKKKLPNLDLGSPHLEVPKRMFSSSCHQVGSKNRPAAGKLKHVLMHLLSDRSLSNRHVKYKKNTSLLPSLTECSSGSSSFGRRPLRTHTLFPVVFHTSYAIVAFKKKINVSAMLRCSRVARSYINIVLVLRFYT